MWFATEARMVPLILATIAWSGTSLAQNAETELPAEGLPHAISIYVGPRYSFVLEPGLPNDNHHALALDLRSRLALGKTVAYLVGLDGAVGLADTGLTYDVEAHVAGLALRWDVGMVGVSGGIGLGGTTQSVPLAAQLPIEHFVESSVGPIRFALAARIRFVFGAEQRRGGSPLLGFADEAGASLYFRMGGERRFWKDAVAGAGPALGVFYREQMGSHVLGLGFALSISGGT